jgi:UDP-N-acetylmuramate dehydrogenase
MMMAQRRIDSLIERLPPVRGRLRGNVPLAPSTWFRVGGPAELLFRPADVDDLAAFLRGCPADVPVTVIGVASNLLVRDGGIPGIVIRLGGDFVRVRTEGERVVAGGGALDVTVAQEAHAAGVGGLEFLSGIPGTIGGAVRMNAGAYGREVVDVIESATMVTGDGRIETLDSDALGLSYRASRLPAGAIVTEAVLRGASATPDAIAARMSEIQDQRSASQPVRARTGGSTFANPPGAKAWELIDRAGCRGLRIGGAQVSEQHCNFLINTGDATAADLETLGEEVRTRVRAACGVDLVWEIKRIGVPA